MSSQAVPATAPPSHSHPRKYAGLTLTGDLGGPEKPFEVVLAGSLLIASRFDSPDSTRILPRVRFEGRMKIRGCDPAPWIGAPEYRHDQPWLADLSTHALIVPAGVGSDVALAQVEARLDWLNLCGEGLVQGIGSTHPAYSATVSAAPLGLAQSDK